MRSETSVMGSRARRRVRASFLWVTALVLPIRAYAGGGDERQGGDPAHENGACEGRAQGALRTCRSFDGFGLLGTITVPPDTTVNPGGKFTAFDIGWVDGGSQRYYLADRSNASVDLFDAEDDLFIARVGGFAGQKVNPDGTANNDISGPDGILVIPKLRQLWAGDGDSTVKVIDLRVNRVIDVISTGGQKRADEMSHDPQDQILAVVNNADDPPFMTFISTKPSDRQVLGHLKLDKADVGFDATGGAEQSVWDPGRRRFYLSIPEVNGNTDGAIAEIDPLAMKVTNLFPLENGCNPAGLALGPDHHLLVGCAAWAGATSHSLVIDDANGSIVADVAGIGGSDEVWFDPGDDHYYLAARDNKENGTNEPALGVVDAKTNDLTTKVSTFTNAHSVAANPENGHVFVPLRSGAPQCSNGCIGVYGRMLCEDDHP